MGLDGKSQVFFKENLKKIKNPLTRALVWRSFWEMVRDGKCSFKDFVQTAVNNLEFEDYSTVNRLVFQWLNGGVSIYSPFKDRINLRKQLF